VRYNRRRIKEIFCIISFLILINSGSVWGEGNKSTSVTSRVKDIARLQGVRSNQLTGMGLIIGLSGTGDSSKANAQIIANALTKWGLQISVSDMKVKNVAAVMMTANLPPYMHRGDTIDVQVASIGDAKSLQGGILLQSPLTGADGKVYAVAQGPVHLGGYAASAGKSSVQKNITTAGMIISGAIIEQEVPMQFRVNDKLRLALNAPDFTTASRLAQSINNNIAKETARSLDMGTVEVTIPKDFEANPVEFIAQIEALPITPDGLAKVIINERTGTVVIGENVRLAPVAVTHRNITVKITSQPKVSQPRPLSEGETKVTDETKVEVAEESGRMIALPEGTGIGTVVRALNKVGTTPQDIITILVAIKNAGGLYGVLEFM
jgi:flagellar P-ring protein precursor FlgI